MKKTLLITSLLASVVLFPKESNAISMPCSMVLDPIDGDHTNSRGSALVYKVQLIPPSFARTNISILSVHLPEPSTYGEYDIYEGFAFIPGEISWGTDFILLQKKIVLPGREELTLSRPN